MKLKRHRSLIPHAGVVVATLAAAVGFPPRTKAQQLTKVIIALSSAMICA